MTVSERIIRIGTRGSLLAMTQANQIRQALSKKYPKIRFEIREIKTFGDEYQGVELFKKNKIGVFTKAIERELLANRIDIAVHSLKDLPTTQPKGLTLAAFPKREDTKDCLITLKKANLKELPLGAMVGTGSLRRKRQLALLRPDLKLIDIRGNLDTRVGLVLKKKSCDAIVLAMAGLNRIQKFKSYTTSLAKTLVMPAVGQGCLGIQSRVKDKEVQKMLKSLNHRATEMCVRAERAFLWKLQGGCRVPVGIITELKNNKIKMHAKVFSVKTNFFLESKIDAAGAPETIGKKLASDLLSKGAGKLLKEARS